MFEAGDIVLRPFPFPDLTIVESRPLLVLTAPDDQGPVTSRAGWRYGRTLLPAHLVEGALPLASWVRTDKVVTSSTGLITRRFGHVTFSYRVSIADDVCRFLHAPLASGAPNPLPAAPVPS